MKTLTFKELIAPSLVLVIICLVVTGALAVTYDATKPVIDEINIQKANEARNEVLPEGAGSFSALDTELMDKVVEVYQADNKSGQVFTVLDKGFGGKLTVMIGINGTGEIQGVKVTKHGETPGLGTKAMTLEYLSQYQGKTSVGIAAGADKNIDAVTGATVTSTAVFRAVQTALAQYTKLGGVK
jgi:electron transport complex protein RnfG